MFENYFSCLEIDIWYYNGIVMENKVLQTKLFIFHLSLSQIRLFMDKTSKKMLLVHYNFPVTLNNIASKGTESHNTNQTTLLMCDYNS